MNNQIKKKAFTMIELMIVVAIISVLSIVLIPKAKSQYEQSKMIGVVKNKDLLETIVRGEYEKPTYEVETEDSSIDRVYKNLENNQDLEEMTNPFSKSGKGIGFIKGNTIEDIHKAGYILTEEPEIETLPKGTVYIVIKDKEVTSGIVNPEELVSIKLINNGQNSYCTILLKNNDIYVLGYNTSGILGTGDNINRLAPTVLTLTPTVKPTSVAIGATHSLAIGTDGNLYSWGSNTFGQLGTGNLIDTIVPTLIKLPNGVKPKTIVAGLYQSSVVGHDGNLYSCGHNAYYQLGTGDAINRSTFTLINIPNRGTIKSISLGSSYTILLTESGEIYSYGLNNAGQLGIGYEGNVNAKNLVKLPNNIKTTSVSAGASHALAIGTDGNLYAWGLNASGQLGLGTTTSKTSPTLVTLPNGVKPKTIYTGNNHTLAIGTDGNLYSWGYNSSGQLGLGDNLTRINPTLINLSNGVKPKSISTGAFHTIAIGTDNNLYAWGSNAYGPLCTGDKINRNAPTLVNPFNLVE